MAESLEWKLVRGTVLVVGCRGELAAGPVPPMRKWRFENREEVSFMAAAIGFVMGMLRIRTGWMISGLCIFVVSSTVYSQELILLGR